jgi:hypothetical protein
MATDLLRTETLATKSVASNITKNTNLELIIM